MNVPQLRFKGFEGEWRRVSIGELGEFLKGSSISKTDLSKDGEPCILYGELYTKYGEVIQNVFSKTNIKLSKKIYGLKNDVLIPSSGETAIDIACASALEVEKVLLGGDLNLFRPNSEVNGPFISYQINGVRKFELSKLAQGASVVHLYSNSLKKFRMTFPILKEQEKISSFLILLNKRIEKQKEKIEELEQFKKGMMQKIFSQELRFKDEDGGEFPEWEEKKIGNFLSESRIMGSKGDVANKLTVKLWGKGIVAKREAIQGSVNTQYYIRRKGQLMYGKLDFLNCAFGIVPSEFDGYESTLDSPAFDIRNIDSRFLLEYIKRKKFYLKYGNQANGSRKAKRIHPDIFFEMPIEVPSKKEQQKISSFLTLLDMKINKEIEQLRVLDEKKNSFMQKMFI
ncbi:restriction endonuclease subunit S [Planococcus maritimus]|uniref:restriction endonuclease subunit S n=1 Tax=Planococcus maritimus TaxID=192421 RepID=UPI0031388FB0